MSILYNFIYLVVYSPLSFSIEIDDFDKAVEDFGVKKANEHGVITLWQDAYLKQEDMATRPRYEDYKVTVWPGQVKYGGARTPVFKSSVIYSQQFDNGESVETTGNFNKTLELMSSNSWRPTTTLSIGYEVLVRAAVPEIVGSHSKYSTRFDLRNDRLKTEIEIETEIKALTIKIPPKTTVMADLIVTTEEREIPWEAITVIKGWFAVKFSEIVLDSSVYMYHVEALDSKKFTYVKEIDGLTHESKGMFNSLRVIETQLKISEFDVDNYNPTDPPKPKKVYFVNI